MRYFKLLIMTPSPIMGFLQALKIKEEDFCLLWFHDGSKDIYLAINQKDWNNVKELSKSLKMEHQAVSETSMRSVDPALHHPEREFTFYGKITLMPFSIR